MRRYWFGDIDGSVCTPAQGDEDRILERCDTIQEKVVVGFVPVSVDEACSCGFFTDREEYLERLRSVTIRDARRKIIEAFSEGDAELIQMVRMLDEMDEVINLLTEKAGEWYLVKNPGFSRKYKSMSAKRMVGVMKKERGPLGKICAEIDGLSNHRAALMRDISKRTDAVMPNCSALVGGLVAARLMERAGWSFESGRTAGVHDSGAGCRRGTLYSSPCRESAAQTRHHLPAPPGAQRSPRCPGEGLTGGRGETCDCRTN